MESRAQSEVKKKAKKDMNQGETLHRQAGYCFTMNYEEML